MLSQTQFFGLLGGLLLLAFVSNRLFKRTGVPDLIVLMGAGLLLGPVFHLVHGTPFRTFTHFLGTLALILILFEGGVELNLGQTWRHFPGGILLAFAGYGFSVALVSLLVWWTLKLPLSSAVLVGAVLGCTSSTMIMPALQQIQPREPVKVILLIEAALGDVIAVFTVGSLVEVAEGDPLIAGLIRGFFTRTIVSSLLALAAALLWARLWKTVAGHRFSTVATLGIVLAIYATTRALGGSGLLAVLVFGLTLGNASQEISGSKIHPRILAFHSELSFLVRSFFFVLLGLEVRFIAPAYMWPILAIIVALVLARFLAVQTGRWTFSQLEPRERKLIFWMLPRGLVTAVLALKILEVKGEQFAFVPTLAFTVILVTNFLMVLGSFRTRKLPSATSPGQPGNAYGDVVNPVI